MSWFKEIFSDTNGLWSSKRIFGGLGFIACIFVLIFSTIKMIQAPVITDAFLMVCAALLGLETVTKAFNKYGKEVSKEE